MKKLILLLIALTMLLSACAGRTSPAENGTTAPTDTSATTSYAPTTAKSTTTRPPPATTAATTTTTTASTTTTVGGSDDKGEDYYKGQYQRDAAARFLDALVSGDYETVAGSLAVWPQLESCKFITDIKFVDYSIEKEYKGNTVEFDVSFEHITYFLVKFEIAESDSDLFSVGEEYWDLFVQLDHYTIPYFKKSVKKKPVDVYMDWRKKYMTIQFNFGYDFSNSFGIFETATDFNSIIEKMDYQPIWGVSHFHGSYSYAIAMDRQQNADQSWPVEYIYESLAYTTGITSIDFELGGGEYDPVTKSVLCGGHGGDWVIAEIVSEPEDDSAPGIYETVVNYYSDSAYFVLACTVKYTYRMETGKVRVMLATERLYDSGYKPLFGCI